MKMILKTYKSIITIFMIALFTGCGPDEPANASVSSLTSITLTSSTTVSDVNSVVTFTVTGNDGIDYTAESTITMADGTEISGNSYTTAAEGTFVFTASYNSLTSNGKQLTVSDTVVKFQKNVLIEDFTGTWCGYCPRVTYGIEQVEAATDFAIPVAIHVFDSMEASGIGTLVDHFNSAGSYPFAKLDRNVTWSSPQPSNLAQVVGFTTTDADLGLSISSALDGVSMTVDVSVKFEVDYSASNLKLIVYILEDNVIQDQTNSTSYYGGASVLTDFVHNDVLRVMLTDSFGDAILSSETVANTTFDKTFSMNVPSNVIDTAEVSVVAFVVDGDTKAVVNVQSAHLGETQAFQAL